MGKNGDGLFFGGIPTAADVKRLYDAYPPVDMTPGYLARYVGVAETIKTTIRSSRWHSVTGKWRRDLKKDYNIILAPSEREPEAFEVYTEEAKARLARRKLKEAARKIRVSQSIAVMVDRKQLTKEQAELLDFTMMTNGAVMATLQLRSKTKNLPDMTPTPKNGGEGNGGKAELAKDEVVEQDAVSKVPPVVPGGKK